MKIKIVSDGTPYNTHVLNADTGEKIEGITSIHWRIDSASEFAHTVLTFEVVPVEVIGETE